MEKRIRARIVSIEPGSIKGQMIATAESGEGLLRFDLISDLIRVGEGDTLEILLSDSKPGEVDGYDFCGRGYLVSSDSGREIFSVWGIIFRFEPPLGLEPDREYFLCIKR